MIPHAQLISPATITPPAQILSVESSDSKEPWYTVYILLKVIRLLWFQMIHNHNQNNQFRSITDCFSCIVVEEIKIFFNNKISVNNKYDWWGVLIYYN